MQCLKFGVKLGAILIISKSLILFILIQEMKTKPTFILKKSPDKSELRVKVLGLTKD